MTVARRQPGASWVALLLAAIFVGVLVAFAPGCGPRAVVVERQYQNAQSSCLDTARQLHAECPSGDACVARLQALDEVCQAEFARICDQGVHARHACRRIR